MSPSIGILYPGPRSVAYSSLAFHLLKGYLTEAGATVRRYFIEDNDLVSDVKGIEGPRRNKALMISLPYELMYPDMVKALVQAGIPPRRGSRGEDDPVIIAGGPAVTANPLPVLGIVDAVLVGEAEPVLDGVVYALEAESRSGILKRLSELKGLLVPGYSSYPVRRVYVEDLNKAWYPIDQRTPRGVEPIWGKAFILETTRGCSRLCRFCMEGTVFRPKRDRSLPVLRRLLDEGVEYNRVSKVSFYSLIFFDNPASDSILEYAVERGLEVSVPSIRAETLTEERARLIAEGGQRTITIAPETGSCRIARAIHKVIGYNGTVRAVENAIAGGLRNIKLYLIVGFPGESSEDIEDTIEMARDVSKLVASSGGTVKATVNPFIPKPVTGMQWAGLEGLETLRPKINYIIKELSKAGVRASTYDPRLAYIQTVLSRGDERLGELIIEWGMRGGGIGAFKTAARKTGVDTGFYAREWNPDYDPPWHALVEHPHAELERLRRDYILYTEAIKAGRTGRIRVPMTKCN